MTKEKIRLLCRFKKLKHILSETVVDKNRVAEHLDYLCQYHSIRLQLEVKK
jgi:hypothetical protein